MGRGLRRMTEMKVYLAGYYGHEPRELANLVQRLDTVVIDIRFHPVSRYPKWNRNALRYLLGNRYQNITALGNAHYKGGPIAIADFDLGEQILHGMSRLRESVILLSVCKNADTCHRTVVGQRLAALGYRVGELDW